MLAGPGPTKPRDLSHHPMSTESGDSPKPEKGSVSIVMIGATGAVGTHVARWLASSDQVSRLTLLGRRPTEGLDEKKVTQHTVDLHDPRSYQSLLHGHSVAICTLGVGEPSKVDSETFIEIDKRLPLDFAIACKSSGVRHFELLGSVGADAGSRSFYLKTKGELVEALKALNFERLSIFQPSMILTPTNRYGLSQGLALAVWPKLSPLMFGPLKKFRGIPVEQLGRVIAQNAVTAGAGVRVLQWEDFQQSNA